MIVTRDLRGLYSPTSAIAFGMIAPMPIPPITRTIRSSSSEYARAVIHVSSA